MEMARPRVGALPSSLPPDKRTLKRSPAGSIKTMRRGLAPEAVFGCIGNLAVGVWGACYRRVRPSSVAPVTHWRRARTLPPVDRLLAPQGKLVQTLIAGLALSPVVDEGAQEHGHGGCILRERER